MGEEMSVEKSRPYLRLVWLLQAAALLGALGICLKLGASLWFIIPGGLCFIVVSVWLGSHLQRDGVTTNRVTSSLLGLGVWIPSAITVGVLAAVLLRINWKDKDSFVAGAFICGFLLLLAAYTLLLGLYSRREAAIRWLPLSLGAVSITLMAAWAVASTVTAWTKPILGTAPVVNDTTHDPAKELEKRARWAKHKGWRKPDGSPIIVAVYLSGGGYRAATFHAGVLKALDEQCVPIRYLSTVSGGSIIGTFYALGYPPELFKKRLLDDRPGLPDELLNVGNVLLDLFAPSWNSAETYARHFRRTLFSAKTFADTGLTPQLLINVTDIEGRIDDLEEPSRREVLFRDRNPEFPQLNDLELAEAVAASGAFPGAFQPKTITWPSYGHANRYEPRSRRFVDGGVVENIGYWGLGRFRSIKKMPEEDIIVVSDASAELIPGKLPSKVELVELLLLSQSIADEQRHDLLLADVFSKAKGVVIWLGKVLHMSPMEKLESLPSWYPSADSQGRISGSVVAEEVAKLPTLNELDEEQVRKAFWTGYSMAQMQWDGLNGLRKRIGPIGPECPAP